MTFYSRQGVYQIVFLLIFVALNTILYVSAEKQSNPEYDTDSPTYLNAADGQRYWGVSLNLVENGTFSIPGSDQVPLEHGPIPALIFYVPIKLAGLNNATVFIVVIQCAMLFAIGLLARPLANPYPVNKDLLQGLLIFNPNLIGLAHHAQSDLIFAFIFSCTLYFLSRCIERPNFARKIDYCMIGFLCGCLLLTRPASVPYVFVLPFLLLLSMFVRRRTKNIDWALILRYLGLGAIITGIIIAPWMARNHVINSSTFLENRQASRTCLDSYDLLLYAKTGKDFDQRASLSCKVVSSYFKSVGRPDCYRGLLGYCDDASITINQITPLTETINSADGTSCKSLQLKACMSAILDEKFTTIAKAYFSGWSALMIGGSTSNIATYLGFHPPSYQRKNYYSTPTIAELSSYVLIMIRENLSYFLFFFTFTGFALISRLIGIVGLISVIRSKSSYPYTLFYCLSITCFLFTYMFVGLSRYRAPLEPMLMLFAAAGIGQCISIVKQYTRKNKLRN